MILHFSHMGLTDARTFIAPLGGTYRDEDQRRAQESAPRPTGKSSSLMPVASQALTAREAGSAGSATSSCQGVKIRGPSAVMATVCSKWAASDPSCE